jgi:hypothetical protein
MHIPLDDILAKAGHRPGPVDLPCPECGPHRHDPRNRKRKVFRAWIKPTLDFASYHCARCGARGHVRADRPLDIPPDVLARHRVEAERQQSRDAAERLRIARHLWQRTTPARGTPVEIYLAARGITCDIPQTLLYLPSNGRHPHAMIAAFGIPEEWSPGELWLSPEDLRGVHLTALAPDGRGKADIEPCKRMIGKSAGWPIVLAPPNDGLALAVGEGVETALSAVQEAGLGGWAAGAASRMAALADQLPSYLESLTILAEPDPAGQRAAYDLADRAERRIGCEVRITEASRD